MRLFAGGIATETNVFAPFPTGLPNWNVIPPSAAPEERARQTFGASFAAYRDVARARGAELVQGTYSWATPLGTTPQPVYERLRDALLEELESALPVDGVLLTLHGSMVADGYDDCETDLVERIAHLAPDAVVGALLDPHCDLPDRLVAAADVLICMKEYPHVDCEERATELAELVVAAARGDVDPAISTFDCRMIATYPTQVEPMAGFVRAMKEAEEEEGVLSVSLGQGFPYADNAFVGSRMLVVTDARPERGAEVAEAFGRRLFELRDQIVVKPLELGAALDRAFASSERSRPVVVADRADNAGGGAPSDSTFVLAELLRRGARDCGIAMLWDPVVVSVCTSAGEGATLALRVGGKMGPMSGEPLDVRATVRKIVPQLVQLWPQQEGAVEVPCGDAVHLDVEGVDVIVNSTRCQVFGTEVFTAFGIDLASRRVLVVKSMNHFAAAFGPHAHEIVYATTPGTLPDDPAFNPYTRVDLHKWPLVDDPWRA